MTIGRNGFIGYTLASTLQCNWWWCENLCSRSFYITLEKGRKKVRRYDTTRLWRSTQLCGSTKSRKEWVRPKLGKDRVCIFFVWQDEMKMRCCLSTPESPEYILRVAHSTSVTPVPPYTHRRSLTIYLEATFELVWRCTWRPRSNELRDDLGGRDRSSLEMHLEAVIEWTERWTPRPRSSEFGNTLGGRDQVNWELHLESVLGRVWRCTWRPKSSELTAALGGCGRASLEKDLEAVIEWTERCTARAWWSECRDALGGRVRVNWELHLEGVIDCVWRCTWRPRMSALRCTWMPWSSKFGDALAGYDRARLDEYLEAFNLAGGTMVTETLYIGWFVIVGM